MNFRVKENSSELWIYNNLDNQDSHPFHFHMTSGFVRFFFTVIILQIVLKKWF